MTVVLRWCETLVYVFMSFVACVIQLLLTLYENLSVTSLKLSNLGAVIKYANEALRIDSNCVKAHYVKGKVHTDFSVLYLVAQHERPFKTFF
jgi:hypothetical protein